MSRLLGDAARQIHAADADERLQTIAHSAVASLPDIDLVSVSLAYPDHRLEMVVGTDPLCQELDDLQSELREGPCVYAADVPEVVRASPLADDPRWPAYAPAALELGLRSQLGVRLAHDKHHMAVLNLYSTSTEHLAEDLEDQVEVFAAYAAMALGRDTTESHLRTAIESRRLVGQAVGVVMARYGLDEEQAFRYLGRISSHENTKLRDVAAQVVAEQNAAAGQRG